MRTGGLLSISIAAMRQAIVDTKGRGRSHMYIERSWQSRREGVAPKDLIRYDVALGWSWRFDDLRLDKSCAKRVVTRRSRRSRLAGLDTNHAVIVPASTPMTSPVSLRILLQRADPYGHAIAPARRGKVRVATCRRRTLRARRPWEREPRSAADVSISAK